MLSFKYPSSHWVFPSKGWEQARIAWGENFTFSLSPFYAMHNLSLIKLAVWTAWLDAHFPTNYADSTLIVGFLLTLRPLFTCIEVRRNIVIRRHTTWVDLLSIWEGVLKNHLSICEWFILALSRLYLPVRVNPLSEEDIWLGIMNHKFISIDGRRFRQRFLRVEHDFSNRVETESNKDAKDDDVGPGIAAFLESLVSSFLSSSFGTVDSSSILALRSFRHFY